jgi:hypothetical protein
VKRHLNKRLLFSVKQQPQPERPSFQIPSEPAAPSQPNVWNNPVPSPTIPQVVEKYWNHNGSLIKLEANGASRRFLYTQPRQGLIEEGVTPGTTEFIGTQTGNMYSGTAYVFSRICGAIGFAVSGALAPDEQSITMTGWVPYIDPQCHRVGGHPGTLVFQLVPSNE